MHSQFTINFHGVGECRRALEVNESAVWITQERFRSILAGLVDMPRVRLTFDDGNESDYEAALKYILPSKLVSTHFLITDRIGDVGYLSAGQIREMIAAGAKIGSHGIAHKDWRLLSGEDLAAETHISKDKLEQAFGVEVFEAACPFGSYDRRVLLSLEDAGYRKIYTSDSPWADHESWLCHRLSVKSEHSAGYVMSEIQRGPRTLKNALSKLKSAIKARR